VNVHKLNSIFKPKRIALIGVSINPNNVSGKVLNNLVGGGFRGVVYPVNPQFEAVLGIQCYPDVFNLPNKPDLAVICSPAGEVPGIISQCGEAGIEGVIIMSAGFREEGEEGKKLEEEIEKIRNAYDIRILGPNCLGYIAPHSSLNVSFGPGMPYKGSIAFISQSGALCTSVLDWAANKKIGFSYFISVGNMLDVDFGDLIDYLGEDEKTESILLYIESITNARKFITAARAFASTKPIITYKAGRFPESAKAASSHTGAMASEDDIYDAAFKRIGATRVFEIGEIFDCAELIGRHKIPRGHNLAIVTNAGGPGVMATDALIESNGKLAKLTDKTIEKLNDSLPKFWSKGNPVDVLGDASSKRITKAVQIVLDDENTDAVLIILTPQAMTNPNATAAELIKITKETMKPILANFMGGSLMSNANRVLSDNNIPAYPTPKDAIKAFMTLVEYSNNLKSLYETPRDIPVEFSIDRKKFRKEFDKLIPADTNILSEETSKKILHAYGIPVTLPKIAKTKQEAVKISNKTGYPVVMKIFSPDITHKTEAGGVILNLDDEKMVESAYERMMNDISKKFYSAKIEGVTVQKMVTEKESAELIVGTKKDDVFGTVIMLGMGGIEAELFRDKQIGFPPLNEKLALRMIESLKIFPLLKGYRGKPPLAIEKLIEILIRLSYFAADYPEITELDINPLLITQKDCIALDARMIIDKSIDTKKIKPYSHLALRPYPEEYVKQVQLRDKTEVTLRPIKPEDEFLWREMLSSCSKETIYSRFRYFFQWDSHEAATRYCFTDYDSEIAIVVEKSDGINKKLLGVGRLVADPNHETVEYAVLVTDEWQDRGLGSVLTDYCFEIVKRWGLKKIVAQTTTDNKRMISVFQKRGFKIEVDPSSSLVEVSKPL